jgi:hypothetical protein
MMATMTRKSRGYGLLLAALVVLLVAACSPEGERVRSGGRGGDIGNTGQPVQLHGDRTRNNPDFQVPGKVQAPREAWGVPVWWDSRAE